MTSPRLRVPFADPLLGTALKPRAGAEDDVKWGREQVMIGGVVKLGSPRRSRKRAGGAAAAGRARDQMGKALQLGCR